MRIKQNILVDMDLDFATLVPTIELTELLYLWDRITEEIECEYEYVWCPECKLFKQVGVNILDEIHCYRCGTALLDEEGGALFTLGNYH